MKSRVEEGVQESPGAADRFLDILLYRILTSTLTAGLSKVRPWRASPEIV